jgi:hypothetical protein
MEWNVANGHCFGIATGVDEKESNNHCTALHLNFKRFRFDTLLNSSAEMQSDSREQQ